MSFCTCGYVFLKLTFFGFIQGLQFGPRHNSYLVAAFFSFTRFLPVLPRNFRRFFPFQDVLSASLTCFPETLFPLSAPFFHNHVRQITLSRKHPVLFWFFPRFFGDLIFYPFPPFFQLCFSCKSQFGELLPIPSPTSALFDLMLGFPKPWLKNPHKPGAPPFNFPFSPYFSFKISFRSPSFPLAPLPDTDEFSFCFSPFRPPPFPECPVASFTPPTPHLPPS